MKVQRILLKMFKGYKVLCVVPARKNSKGLKNKNIQKINDKEIIYYPIKAGLKSRYIDEVIFSSDSKKYIKIAKKYGASIYFQRPKKISKDSSSSFQVINHAISFLKNKNLHFDIIVLLEPTSPLTNHKDIDQAIKMMVEKEYLSLVSVMDSSKYNINFQFKELNNILKPFIKKGVSKRRQQIKKTYCLDGSLYISYIKEFLKNKNFISKKTMGYKIKPIWKNFEIDNKDDLNIIRLITRLKYVEI